MTTCKHCNRETFPPYPMHRFDTCAYHWLGPDGNYYSSDFDALLLDMDTWMKEHPGAVLLSADRFPMLGWTAYLDTPEGEVMKGWVISIRDVKSWHARHKRARQRHAAPPAQENDGQPDPFDPY